MTKSRKNVTFDELSVGQSAILKRRVEAHDLALFAHLSGDVNHADFTAHDVDGDGRPDATAPEAWLGLLAVSALTSILPGPGTLIKTQKLLFRKPVRLGERITLALRCSEKMRAPAARFTVQISSEDDEILLDGEIELEAPLKSVAIEPHDLPLILAERQDHFQTLLNRCLHVPPLKTAVVCPDDRHSLGGALLSYKERLIEPILIGDEKKIRQVAAELGDDLKDILVINMPDHAAAATKAVAMAAAGEVRALMKGNIHSDELLAQVVKKDGGLRATRRLSHVFVLDAPLRDRLIFVSDAAINIAPDLSAKVDITQNAIDLARACGLSKPRVGILAAVETVNVSMPATLDAAILSKMADRGQISGGIVDGPLAMDNAVDVQAARTKGIRSLVAGRADVLIVPNLETGNILAKELIFVSHADAAGLVVGAKVPIVLTSRADNDRARLASCALAQLYQHWLHHGEPLGSEPSHPEAA